MIECGRPSGFRTPPAGILKHIHTCQDQRADDIGLITQIGRGAENKCEKVSDRHQQASRGALSTSTLVFAAENASIVHSELDGRTANMRAASREGGESSIGFRGPAKKTQR